MVLGRRSASMQEVLGLFWESGRQAEVEHQNDQGAITGCFFIGAYLPVCKVEAPQRRPPGKEDTGCRL